MNSCKGKTEVYSCDLRRFMLLLWKCEAEVWSSSENWCAATSDLLSSVILQVRRQPGESGWPRNITWSWVRTRSSLSMRQASTTSSLMRLTNRWANPLASGCWVVKTKFSWAGITCLHRQVQRRLQNLVTCIGSDPERMFWPRYPYRSSVVPNSCSSSSEFLGRSGGGARCFHYL